MDSDASNRNRKLSRDLDNLLIAIKTVTIMSKRKTYRRYMYLTVTDYLKNIYCELNENKLLMNYTETFIFL